MKSLIERIMSVGASDPMPLANLMLKLTEEVGELAEAINHHQGYLPNKKMKEPVVGEIADVINTVIGVFVHAYPNLSQEQMYDLLSEALRTKTDKWEMVIAERKSIR